MKKILIITPSVFTAQELRHYERQILDNRNVTEREASDFFWKFPKFLTIGGYKSLAREVALCKNGEEIYRVDFVRCRFGDDHWDFIELKSPQAPFIVKKGSHLKVSSVVQLGVEQARNYSDFMEESLNRYELEKREGIKVFRPKLLLVGGRKDNTIKKEDIIRLVSRYNNIDIQTYDDIYSFAKDNYCSSCIPLPVLQSSDAYVPDTLESKESKDNSYGGITISKEYEDLEADYDRYVARWEERGPRAGPHPDVWYQRRRREIEDKERSEGR